MRYWSTNNPYQLHQLPLHDPKLTVWFAVLANRIIRGYFFGNETGQICTVNSICYRNTIDLFLAAEVERCDNLWYQQDTRYICAYHTTQHGNSAGLISWAYNFPLGDISLPSLSPDFTTIDFFLWGYLKEKVFVTRPKTLKEQKYKICKEINIISPGILQNIIHNFQHRMQKCICSGGAHLKGCSIQKVNIIFFKSKFSTLKPAYYFCHTLYLII